MADPTPTPTPVPTSNGNPSWQWLINQGVAIAIAAYILVMLNGTIGSVNDKITQMTLAIAHQTDVVADKCK